MKITQLDTAGCGCDDDHDRVIQLDLSFIDAAKQQRARIVYPEMFHQSYAYPDASGAAGMGRTCADASRNDVVKSRRTGLSGASKPHSMGAAEQAKAMLGRKE